LPAFYPQVWSHCGKYIGGVINAMNQQNRIAIAYLSHTFQRFLNDNAHSIARGDRNPLVT